MTTYGILLVDTNWSNNELTSIEKAAYLSHSDDLITGARNGSQRAVGRLLSLVEGERRDEVLAAIDPSSVRVVGVTGPPGAGTSAACTGSRRVLPVMAATSRAMP